MRLCLAILSVGLAAHAQDRPPRLVEVAPLARLEGETADAIEVEILVDAEGHATLESCDATPLECESASAVIAEGRFEPATRDDAPIAARIRARLVYAPLPRAESPPPPPPPIAQPPSEMGVTAIVPPQQRGARRFTLSEARDLPGAMGDPLRAALVLPGVVPLGEGLPFFYLRGAPASGTIYYFDSIPLPALFHMAPGASVVHPRMLGDIQIVSGVPTARYGRFTGGVIIGDGPPTPQQDVIAEGEARLTDVSAYAHGRAGNVEASAAARYGWPGVIASLFLPESINLQYADYQLRGRWRIDSNRRIELVWLGSWDLLATNTYIGFEVLSRATTSLLFHRGELRYVANYGNVEVGAALRFGQDDGSTIGDMGRLGVTALSGGGRVWVTIGDRNWRLHLGGESYAGGGEITGRDTPHPILGLVGGRRLRSIDAVFAELTWQPWTWLTINAGVRADFFVDPRSLLASLDPRVRVEWEPDPAVKVYAAFGLAHQPSIYILPLPALNELPTRAGLQNATQSEVGAQVRARTGDIEVTVDARGYLHRYENMVVEDFIDTRLQSFCTMTLQCVTFTGDDRLNYTTWGLELDARAALGSHFSLRFAYTLAFLDAEPYMGFLQYTPSQDVQDVFHFIAMYDSGIGFTAGLRAFLRSGEVRGNNYLDPPVFGRVEYRLPWWGRIDANIAYGWDAGWARLRVSLDWINVLWFLGGPPLSMSCLGPGCSVQYAPGFPLPSAGLRGTFE